MKTTVAVGGCNQSELGQAASEARGGSVAWSSLPSIQVNTSGITLSVKQSPVQGIRDLRVNKPVLQNKTSATFASAKFEVLLLFFLCVQVVGTMPSFISVIFLHTTALGGTWGRFTEILYKWDCFRL